MKVIKQTYGGLISKSLLVSRFIPSQSIMEKCKELDIEVFYLYGLLGSSNPLVNIIKILNNLEQKTSIWAIHFASTLPKPHKPKHNPKLCQRACKANARKIVFKKISQPFKKIKNATHNPTQTDKKANRQWYSNPTLTMVYKEERTEHQLPTGVAVAQLLFFRK